MVALEVLHLHLPWQWYSSNKILTQQRVSITCLHEYIEAFAQMLSRLLDAVIKIKLLTTNLTLAHCHSFNLIPDTIRWFHSMPSNDQSAICMNDGHHGINTTTPCKIVCYRHLVTWIPKNNKDVNSTYLYKIEARQQGNAVFRHLAFWSFFRRHCGTFSALFSRKHR